MADELQAGAGVVKDPRAAALMSGDIDQVFTAFGLTAGFLNRKNFLGQHPEIIEYINAKIGEARIASNSEGYKGTSEENGAYIDYFKDHVTDIEKLVNGPAVSDMPMDLVSVAAPVQTAAPLPNEMPVSEPQQAAPAVTEIQLTEPVPPLEEQKEVVPEQVATVPVNEQTLGIFGAPPQELASHFDEEKTLGGLVDELKEPMAAPNVVSGPQAEVAESSPAVVTSEAPVIASLPTANAINDSEQIAAEPAIVAPLISANAASVDSAAVPEASLTATPSQDQQIVEDVQMQHADESEEDDDQSSTAAKTGVTSFYELEELDWWPLDDINLEVKDKDHAVMEIIHGAGLMKRAVIWTLNLLFDGRVWIFTDDHTVPVHERDQILQFDEFRELIENSY